MHVSRIIHHAHQLLTVAAPPGGGPRRGAQMADIGLIENGALALKGEVIVAVGTSARTPALRPAHNASSACTSRPSGMSLSMQVRGRLKIVARLDKGVTVATLGADSAASFRRRSHPRETRVSELSRTTS